MIHPKRSKSDWPSWTNSCRKPRDSVPGFGWDRALAGELSFVSTCSWGDSQTATTRDDDMPLEEPVGVWSSHVPMLKMHSALFISVHICSYLFICVSPHLGGRLWKARVPIRTCISSQWPAKTVFKVIDRVPASTEVHHEHLKHPPISLHTKSKNVWNLLAFSQVHPLLPS